MALRMRLLMVATAAARSAVCQPASWLPDIASADKLWAPDDSNVTPNNMPEIGNGFVATQLMTDSLWVSGVFNGYETVTPSQRARVPSSLSTVAVKAPGTPADAALDVRQATYYRRSYLDPNPSCSPSSNTSCSTSPIRLCLEQRFYAHRVLPSVMVMEVEVLQGDGQGEDGAAPTITVTDAPLAYVRLDPVPAGPSDAINFTAVPGLPPSASYSIAMGWTQIAELNTSSLTAVAVLADNLTSSATPYGLWPLQGPGIVYTWLTVVRTSIETPAAALVQAVQSDYAAAQALAAAGTLHSSHVAEWEATIWPSGFEIDRLDMAQAVNASLYAILSSARTDRPFGLSPGGLTPGYNGHTFWDQETWMFPAVLLTHPDLAASLLEYRSLRLPGARAKAASYSPPYQGAMFPWESAFTGQETCPSWAPTGLREVHISGDIAFAVWQFWRASQDMGSGWLNASAWPLLEGIADFWVSRVSSSNPQTVIAGWQEGKGRVLDEEEEDVQAVESTKEDVQAVESTKEDVQAVESKADETPLRLCEVIPPDEYADHVCDSVYTNAVAILALTYATQAAQLLGLPPSTYTAWQDVASRLPIPFNTTGPGVPEGGVHPEYAGYFNVTVKQADTILLGFPLGITFGDMTPASRANDLHWYSKVTDGNGPAMTWGMFTIGYVELGLWDDAASNLNRSFANVQPPFAVWTETPSGGCANFLTGAGGFLQTAYFGYTGLRFNDTSLRMAPVLPPGSTTVKLRGMAYRGNRLDITYDNSSITVMAQANPVPSSTVQDREGQSEVTDGSISSTGRRYHLNTAAMDAAQAAADPALSLLPPTSLDQRSQTGRVVINGYRPPTATPGANGSPALGPREGSWTVTPTPLALIDAAGNKQVLLPGVPQRLALQDITVMAA